MKILLSSLRLTWIGNSEEIAPSSILWTTGGEFSGCNLTSCAVHSKKTSWSWYPVGTYTAMYTHELVWAHM